MSNHKFQCSSCSRSYESSPTLLECDKCGSPLNISYITQPASDLHPTGWSGHPISLPLNHQKDLITLGEGNTPVVQLNNVKNRIGAEIYVKQEYMNPTGSFKDRGTSLMVSALKSFGINELVTPNNYSISSIYPNPFNPTTNIIYELPENNTVNIAVYDLNGQIVRHLVNKFQTTGIYTVTWKATGYPSGLYFIHMQSGSFYHTKKVVLLK